MTALRFSSSNDDRARQLIVNVVSAILDGNRAAAPSAGNNGNRLAAMAAQGEEKCIEFFIIRLNSLNDVLLAYLCNR